MINEWHNFGLLSNSGILLPKNGTVDDDGSSFEKNYPAPPVHNAANSARLSSAFIPLLPV